MLKEEERREVDCKFYITAVLKSRNVIQESYEYTGETCGQREKEGSKCIWKNNLVAVDMNCWKAWYCNDK